MAHQNGWILVAEVKVNEEIYNPNIGSEQFLLLLNWLVFCENIHILGRDFNVHL